MVALRALILLTSALYASALVVPRQAPGTQFITGPCTSDVDCASDCCGFNTGKCAGPVIAQQRDGGCGFGDGVPNNRAAQVIQGPNAIAAPGVNNGGGNAPAPAPAPQTPAPPQAPGTQFITGPCASDADCASGCCGFNTGKCAGAIVAQERDGGCGFGDGVPNDRAAQALRGNVASAPAPAPAPQSPAPQVLAGTQFITGVCASDADCASGCCGFNTGKCAGAIVAQERDGGCGFGDATPNDRAAQALRGNTGAPAPAPAAPAPQTPAPARAPGTQFITGVCASDADCASGCCGFNSGKCAGAIIAQERDGGCGFGDATPNDRAAQALRGAR